MADVVITISGPAGAFKSTIAEECRRHLNEIGIVAIVTDDDHGTNSLDYHDQKVSAMADAFVYAHIRTEQTPRPEK